jgi:hypothetical protein
MTTGAEADPIAARLRVDLEKLGELLADFEILPGGLVVLGYQLTLVVAAPGSKPTAIHAAITREDARPIVRSAILEKTLASWDESAAGARP